VTPPGEPSVQIVNLIGWAEEHLGRW
jgi:hypothetical protein